MIFKLTKVILVLFWIVWLLALLSILPEPWSQRLMWTGVALLVIHLGEYLFLHAKVAALQDGNSGFLGFMVFGFGYWLPVLNRSKAGLTGE